MIPEYLTPRAFAKLIRDVVEMGNPSLVIADPSEYLVFAKQIDRLIAIQKAASDLVECNGILRVAAAYRALEESLGGAL